MWNSGRVICLPTSSFNRLRVSSAEAIDALRVDLSFDRASVVADLSLEVRTAAGDLLANTSTTLAPGLGPLRLSTGPTGPGEYDIVVRHLSGTQVPEYVMQAFRRLELDTSGLRDWTVTRPYEAPIGVTGAPVADGDGG